MWKTVKLGEICELNYGKALDKKDRVENGIIPAYGANGIKAFANKPLYDKPSILIGRKGSAGEINKVVDIEVLSLCSVEYANPKPSYIIRQQAWIREIQRFCEIIPYYGTSYVTLNSVPINGFLIKWNSSPECSIISSKTPCGKVKISGSEYITQVGDKRKTFLSITDMTTYCESLSTALSIQGFQYQDNDTDISYDKIIAKNQWTHGNKTILAFIVEFSDNLGYPAADVIESSLIEVGEMFHNFSYGKVSFNQPVIFPKIINVSNITCRDSMIEVVQTAAANGYKVAADYDFLMIFFQQRDCGGWSGTASVGGTYSIINWNDNDRKHWTQGVVSHELGHNFGLFHASNHKTHMLDILEYGDRTDVMGNRGEAMSHFNVGFKRKLGWITNNQTLFISENIETVKRKSRNIFYSFINNTLNILIITV